MVHVIHSTSDSGIVPPALPDELKEVVHAGRTSFIKMIISKYLFSESRRSWRGPKAALHTSARYSIWWLNTPQVCIDVLMDTHRPTLLVSVSNIYKSAFVWSVKQFLYMDT